MPRMKKPAKTPPDFAHSDSLDRLAKRWNLSRRQVRRLVQQGRLPFVEVMGRIRVPHKQPRPEA